MSSKQRSGFAKVFRPFFGRKSAVDSHKTQPPSPALQVEPKENPNNAITPKRPKRDTVRYRIKNGPTCELDCRNETCSKFGFLAGQNLITEFGRAVVIGVYQNKIWFHIEGDNGCVYWDTHKSCFSSQLPHKDSHKLPYKANSGDVFLFDTSQSACAIFGFFSGQRVQASTLNGTVIGVFDSTLWFHMDGNRGATHWNFARNAQELQRHNISLLSGDNEIQVKPCTKPAHAVLRGKHVWTTETICRTPEDFRTMTVDDNGAIYYVTTKGHLMKMQDGKVTALFQSPDTAHLPSILWTCDGKIYATEYKQRNIVWEYDLHSRRLQILAGNSTKKKHKDGKLKKAKFDSPMGLRLDKKGNLYVTDWHHVRKINLKKRTVKTIAGCTSGDPEQGGHEDGEALKAKFKWPAGIAVCDDDTIYVCDQQNHCIRQIKDGIVSTLTGKPGVAGDDDGPFSTATFSRPTDLVMCPDGSMLLSSGYKPLRRINLKEKTVTTLSKFHLAESFLASNKKGEIFVAVKGGQIFKLHNAWRTERLLWIGHLKESEKDCPLARLPREILKEILFIRQGLDDVVYEGLYKPIY